jgi:hypothetical protein
VWKKLANLDQLAAMTNDQITLEINELLVPTHGIPANVSPADVMAAQFYMTELDRRKDALAQAERDRIETNRWRTDLINEFIIIGMIGVEIILSIYGVRMAISGDRRQSQDVERQLVEFSSDRNRPKDSSKVRRSDRGRDGSSSGESRNNEQRHSGTTWPEL